MLILSKGGLFEINFIRKKLNWKNCGHPPCRGKDQIWSSGSSSCYFFLQWNWNVERTKWGEEVALSSANSVNKLRIGFNQLNLLFLVYQHCLSTRAKVVSGTLLGRAAFYCNTVLMVVRDCIPFLLKFYEKVDGGGLIILVLKNELA